MTAAILGASTWAQRNEAIADQAIAKVSRFPLWKLRDAEVVTKQVPDIWEPPGNWHRWVLLKYRTWFAIVRHKTLYCEISAIDDDAQEAVRKRVQLLLTAIRSV